MNDLELTGKVVTKIYGKTKDQVGLIEKMQQDIKTLQDGKAPKSDVDNLQKQINDIVQGGVGSATSEQLATLQKDIDELKATQNNTNTFINETNTYLSKIETQVEQNKTDIQENKTQRELLENRVKTLEQKISDLSSGGGSSEDITKLQSELDALKVRVDELDMKTLEQQIKELDAKIDALNIDQIQQQINDVKQQLDTVDLSNYATKTELTNVKSELELKINNINTKLENVADTFEIEKLQQQIDELRYSINTDIKNKIDLINEVNGLQTKDIQALTKRVSELEKTPQATGTKSNHFKVVMKRFSNDTLISVTGDRVSEIEEILTFIHESTGMGESIDFLGSKDKYSLYGFFSDNHDTVHYKLGSSVIPTYVRIKLANEKDYIFVQIERDSPHFTVTRKSSSDIEIKCIYGQATYLGQYGQTTGVYKLNTDTFIPTKHDKYQIPYPYSVTVANTTPFELEINGIKVATFTTSVLSGMGINETRYI